MAPPDLAAPVKGGRSRESLVRRWKLSVSLSVGSEIALPVSTCTFTWRLQAQVQ